MLVFLLFVMHTVAGSELRNKVQFVWANQEDDAEVRMGSINVQRLEGKDAQSCPWFGCRRQQ